MLLSRGSPGTIWKAKRFQADEAASWWIQSQKQELLQDYRTFWTEGELDERRKSTEVGGQGSQVSSPANGGRQTGKRPAPGYEFGDQSQSRMSQWLG